MIINDAINNMVNYFVSVSQDRSDVDIANMLVDLKNETHNQLTDIINNFVEDNNLIYCKKCKRYTKLECCVVEKEIRDYSYNLIDDKYYEVYLDIAYKYFCPKCEKLLQVEEKRKLVTKIDRWGEYCSY